MEPRKYPIIKIIAGILTVVAFISVVLQVYITKQTEHLTFTWIILFFISQLLLLIYGIINNKYRIYLPSLILIIGLLYILKIKQNNLINRKIEKELKQKNIL